MVISHVLPVARTDLVAVFEELVQDGLLLVVVDAHALALDCGTKEYIDQQSSKSETPPEKFEKRSY